MAAFAMRREWSGRLAWAGSERYQASVSDHWLPSRAKASTLRAAPLRRLGREGAGSDRGAPRAAMAGLKARGMQLGNRTNLAQASTKGASAN